MPSGQAGFKGNDRLKERMDWLVARVATARKLGEGSRVARTFGIMVLQQKPKVVRWPSRTTDSAPMRSILHAFQTVEVDILRPDGGVNGSGH